MISESNLCLLLIYGRNDKGASSIFGSVNLFCLLDDRYDRLHVLANKAPPVHLKTVHGAMIFLTLERASLFTLAKCTFLSATCTSIFQ